MRREYKGLVMILVLFTTLLYSGTVEDDYDKARERMVEIIAYELKETKGYLGKEKLSKSTVEAMKKVRRHEFVPENSRFIAYANRPLPIGHGQTISQPYIVAIMTDLLDLEASDKVLEIGTGSGYQAAVLAEVVKEVHTIEVIPELGATAAKLLDRLGYKNIETAIGDGYYGITEHAPYDAIIVTAAAGNIPPPLLKQLRPGGKMIIPVKSLYQVQHLILISKDEKGIITTRQILPVMFVPLTGRH